MALLHLTHISFILLLLFCGSSFAKDNNDQDTQQKNTSVTDSKASDDTGKSTYGNDYARMMVTLGRTGIDKDVAYAEHIDDSATSLRFGWEQKHSQFIWGVGVNIYFYGDQAGFSQRVESVWGGSSYNHDSDAAGVALYGELGHSYRVADNVSLDLLAGVEISVSSERTIPNCSDCYKQDIDVSSGFHITPRISFHTSQNWSFGFSYQHFISGDFESTPMLWANFSF